MSGSVILRGLAVAALAGTALAASLSTASARSARNVCGRYPYTDTSTHWKAVFGHTTSLTQAVLLRRKLIAKAFKGIEFDKRYCDDIELEVPGVDSPADRKALAQEGDDSNVAISFESPDNQKPNKPGEVTAVFGHMPTLKRASALQNDIAVKGWRENDIIRNSLHDWIVVVHHIPGNVKSDFAAEARSAGYNITFVG